MADEPNFYALLGVERNATEAEIRSAYREMACKHHPEVNPGDAKAEETFKQLSRAYHVLTSADKRKLHDELGVAAVREGFDPE